MRSITAIVPTYNRKAFLRETIVALQGQTRPVDQIIVWDDGSSDGTDMAVKDIDDARLEYFQAKNSGKSAALNKAMKHATGDYIWICDDDDIALPDAAERLGAILDNDESVGIAGGRYNRFSVNAAGEKDIVGPGYWPALETGSPLRHILEDIFLFQNAMLVRRSCYDRVGPFREDLARSIDYDMMARLGLRFGIRMIDDVVFLQRKHDGARGPARARHAAAKVDSVWAEQDRVVFEGLRDQLQLSIFEAMFDGPAAQVTRCAYLQRGCVYARHGLWDAALDDLEAAAGQAAGADLHKLEVDTCRRAVSGKHGVWLTDGQLTRLRGLRAKSGTGRAISRSLGRGLLWSVRKAVSDKDRREALRLLRILFATGVSFRDPRQSDGLTERAVLPPEAYQW